MSLENPFIAERIAMAMQGLGNLPVELPALLMQAGNHMAEQIISEKKIIAAGIGKASPLAQLFCNNLVYQPPDLRPALPALMLATDAAGLTEAISHDYAEQSLLRPLEAMAQAGDVLLLVCDDINNRLASTLLQAAGEKQLASVVIGSNVIGSNVIGSVVKGTVDANNAPAGIKSSSLPAIDFLLQLEAGPQSSQYLLTQFILQCLNDIIDERIFGGY